MRSCAGERGNASLSVERPAGVEAGWVRAASRGSGAEWMAGFESFMLGWTAFLLWIGQRTRRYFARETGASAGACDTPGADFESSAKTAAMVRNCKIWRGFTSILALLARATI